MMQQEQTTTPAPQPHDTFHWILTLELPDACMGTFEGTDNPPAGSTRREAYLAIKQAVEDENPKLRGAHVIYFSFERNQL